MLNDHNDDPFAQRLIRKHRTRMCVQCSSSSSLQQQREDEGAALSPTTDLPHPSQSGQAAAALCRLPHVAVLYLRHNWVHPLLRSQSATCGV